ncbi:serine/threonine-protein kinase [Microbacterium radiodurans]|uniref:Uncharacterized protein n=1 Tax=Microbacterium radiodurans TaxID=661398 RepID=A0A5J5ITA7_9MICO|nr:hypothetical protein [Microbacterium radiodurans]KAA9089098.1 hypothetical protein F6B42_00925 [Microbacterium radiodurans]
MSWALGRLRSAAAESPGHETGGSIHLILGSSDATAASPPPDRDDPRLESYALRTDDIGSDPRIRITAGGDRGFVYAITEIAERLRASGPDALRGWGEQESPAASLRGIQRNFSSVHEDSPWFHDRDFWGAYLDHLATQRFNRFQLALGMQYNYGTGWESRTVSDNYLVFAYPFLVSAPGYDVSADGVAAEERDRNLASLRFIASETRRRGMSFQLGLWNHAYTFGADSPEWYPIRGLDADSHAAYCAAALAELLRSVPEIDGLTLRVHHEGGIPERGREAFWGGLFEAASRVGRPLEIDMHAKGVDPALIRAAMRPNLRPVISAKYLAEHMGLPYHQTSIRTREQSPVRFAGQDASVTGVTDGPRRFTRYGFADYLSEDRVTDVAFRMWPGTQKLLLWGDPAFAAGYARSATIGGAQGLEYCEPLTFKGRRGSGRPGRRDPYEDRTLRLGLADWTKYRYTYVLWGRLLYNPDTDPEVWQRVLRADHGEAAADVEAALAALSRVLPLVAHVHGVSAANNFYSPELYVDLPISDAIPCRHYAWDTGTPRTWEGVSTFDPTLFSSVGEFVDDALHGTPTARYTPLEVARWLEELSRRGRHHLREAERSADPESPQTRRTIIDLEILADLGEFFAGKFRAAVEYAVYRRSGDGRALAACVSTLATAHSAYARVAATAEGVYRSDLAFGVGRSDRGAWSDRLDAMRADLAALRDELARADEPPGATARPAFVGRSDRWIAAAHLDAPETFVRGAGMPVTLRTDEEFTRVVLHFRHLDQSESWRKAMMARSPEGWVAEIPGEYTMSSSSLTFFAEVSREGSDPVFVPALDAALANQPYLVRSSDPSRRQ